MACSFTIPFSGSAENVLSKARSSVQGQGGSLQGDENQGTFQVSVVGSTIRGSYSVSGQEMFINIDSKPFLLPCSAIENFLKNQIR